MLGRQLRNAEAALHMSDPTRPPTARVVIPAGHWILSAAVWFWLAVSAAAQNLRLPERPLAAPAGAELVERWSQLDLTNPEAEILAQVVAGNVPAFYRVFCPVTVTNVVAGKTNWGRFLAAPDYLAVGSDADYFFTPLTPVTAQCIADQLDCTLPTRKMVNDIYVAAAVKLTPSPLKPGPQMITVPVFAEHNAAVRAQRAQEMKAHPLGALVAGDKKDIVITARLTNSPGKVAIYGWHRTNGVAIQPLYLGHTANWADYSHGVRLVRQPMIVNGVARTVAEVLADPELCGLLSDEGVVTTPRYETNGLPALPASMREILQPKISTAASASEFKPTGSFGEMTASFVLDPEVKVLINAPLREQFSLNKPVTLIFFALPNGNTIEQTIGRKTRPEEDWHFNIQHIGAQTRFLRERLPGQTIVVAYLEAGMKSWPAWRKKHGDEKIPALLAEIKSRLPRPPNEIVLASHSGGGSLMFGYLNAKVAIPAEITRLAFLDSNYAYSPTNHLAKLGDWLQASASHHLCVLAYHDDIALLDGKPFVSVAGGTWGRSHAMLADLEKLFPFGQARRGELTVHSALGGRLQLLLLENPERKILHTVQVERNGFIHAMLAGTKAEGVGYEYFGERAYDRWIAGPE